MSSEIKSLRHGAEIEGSHDIDGPDRDRLRFINDAVPALLSYIDADCRYRVCNRAYSDWFGLSRDKVIGRTMQEVVGAEAWKAFQPHVKEVLAGRPVQFETEAKYKSGGTRWIRVSYTPDLDDQGRVLGFAVLVNDITGSRRADEVLRQSESILQKAVAAKTVGVLFFDLNGHIHNANDAFERMSGYTREELRHAVHWKVLTAPEFLQPTIRTAESLATKGEAPPYEKEMIRKDGSRWWGLFAPTRLSGRGSDSECMEFIIDITGHKQAERSLRESEKRFRSFVEATAHVIWRTNARGEVDQPIPLWNAFTGQIDQEASGFGWMNAIHPEDRARVAAAWQKANAEKGTYEVEYRLRVQSGEWRHVLARGVPVFNANQDIAEYIGTCIDVTDRRLAEESFQQLAENIPQLAWMVNADGWIFWFNKRWFEYTGTTLEQMRGWGWQVVHHPDHSERVTKSWLRAMETGQPWQDTFPLRGKDGTYRWFLSRAFPLRDAEGKIFRWFGTNTDITELREAEAKLAEREAVLRTVTNEARVGLVMVNEERRYVFANQTYADILGLHDGNIIGKRVSEVLPAVYEEQIKPRLDRAFRGERLSYELRIPRHPEIAEERLYEVTYEPRQTDEGRYVVVVLVDITERKKAQELLERTVNERTAALRESNEQMEAFTYTIAHDLRAPLRGQQGFAHGLLEEYGPALGETGRGYAQRIIESADRMNALINDLLAYSRLSKTELRVEKVDLKKLVSEVCDEMRFQIRDANATVQVDPFEFTVCAHELTLRTAIQNLVANALKFTKPGVPSEIRIHAEDRAEFIRLWIEDNGIGIAPEHHHEIFGVFHRLHKIGRYPGTGVGLAIVQKGIERMGGRSGVESEEGVGSRFWIELERAG